MYILGPISGVHRLMGAILSSVRLDWLGPDAHCLLFKLHESSRNIANWVHRHQEELENMWRSHARHAAELNQQVALLQVRVSDSLCHVGSGPQHNAVLLLHYCRLHAAQDGLYGLHPGITLALLLRLDVLAKLSVTVL